MRRLLRWAFNLAALVSAVLWAVSYPFPFQWLRVKHYYDSQGDESLTVRHGVAFSGGSVHAFRFSSWPLYVLPSLPRGLAAQRSRLRSELPSAESGFRGGTDHPFDTTFGFGYGRYPSRWSGMHMYDGSRYSAPLWPVVLAWVAVAVTRRRRTQSRALKPSGLCPSCGYDLRATPGRCPECGAVPAKGATA